MEPVFLAEILATKETLGSVYTYERHLQLLNKISTLSQRRCHILSEDYKAGSSVMMVIKAYLPVVESFGFLEELKLQSGGAAFANCIFDR